MGTKNDPGPIDCYKAAGGDEPIFTLRASDPSAPATIRAWVNFTLQRYKSRAKLEKLQEALSVADAMEKWLRQKNAEKDTPDCYPAGMDNYGVLPDR